MIFSFGGEGGLPPPHTHTQNGPAGNPDSGLAKPGMILGWSCDGLGLRL